MRALLLISVLAFQFACFAAALTPEESKKQEEFRKTYHNPDKSQRLSALSILEGAKHSSSWQMLYGIATSDPEESVRFGAIGVLAKEPARDNSISRLIAQFMEGIRNDTEKKTEVVKLAASSEFKYEITASAVDTLMKLRYPDVPALIQSGTTNNMQQIQNIKKQRKQYEELLDAFNAIAKSEVSAPSKDAPVLLRKWWEANQAKFAADDRALTDKYRKEDAEAAKAAAEAKKNK